LRGTQAGRVYYFPDEGGMAMVSAADIEGLLRTPFLFATQSTLGQWQEAAESYTNK
jgi:hypothetical protein